MLSMGAVLCCNEALMVFEGEVEMGGIILSKLLL